MTTRWHGCVGTVRGRLRHDAPPRPQAFRPRCPGSLRCSYTEAQEALASTEEFGIQVRHLGGECGPDARLHCAVVSTVLVGEGIAEATIVDSGQAMILEVLDSLSGANGGFVRLHSVNEDGTEHPLLSDLAGRRLRVTVEVVGS